VQCTSDSHCGAAIDWDCNDNSCVRVARCGNGIIEPENNEQCDDPIGLGQGTCTGSCRIGEAYSECAAAHCWHDDQGFCGHLLPEWPTTCYPYCSADGCPQLVGWETVCVLQMACMLECVNGTCPLGYSCIHTDFGGGQVYDVCMLQD